MSEDIMGRVIEAMEYLEGDITVPKNVKSKLGQIKAILQGNDEASIKVNKALNELDEINDDPNLQAFTRTQIYNIVSMLEQI